MTFFVKPFSGDMKQATILAPVDLRTDFLFHQAIPVLMG